MSLLGPSGCGKSTLLRLIADLDMPTAGEIRVNGKSPRAARGDRDYGMVFQSAGLFEWRTAVRNIELPLKLMGFSRADRRALATEILDLVQLAASSPTTTRGSCRVACSSACRSPARWRSGRDAADGRAARGARRDDAQRLQIELMRRWRDTGLTVVFVTHSVTEAVFSRRASP